ncbi:MAG: S9 family peptidase [Ilumatobacteraceae bacterium]
MTNELTTITDRLLAQRSPQHASLSADGARMLLTTTEVPIDGADEVLHVTVIDVATGNESVVTVVAAGEHSPVWSPDGHSIAWCATLDDGTPVLKVADAVDGTARVLTSSAGACAAPVWSPDGSHLVVPARPGTVIDRSAPYRWTRPIAAADGLGPLEDPPQLLLVEVHADRARWLTNDGWRWSAPNWSPDSTRLAAVSSIDPEGRRSGSRLALVSFDGTAVEAGVPAGRSIATAWLPDGRLTALVAEPRTGALGGDAEMYVIDAEARVARRLDHPQLFGDVYGDNPAVLPESYENVLLSDGTGRLVVRVGARGRLGVVRLHPDEPDSAEVLADGARCCTPVAAVGDRVVVTTQDPVHVPEVAVLEHGTERLLTGFGAAVEQAIDVRRFTVEQSNGWSLDGWLATPLGSVSPVPTVVMVHGGPHFSFGEIFSIDTHALCAAGFGVLFTNPRGSTGYGASFAQACHGDWAEGPASDIVAVLDHAVAAGWVDGSRVGITGLSYGGYMSAWLAATSTRFRAAVIENPVTDLMSMYGTSDIGVSFFPANFGGAPHEALEVYVAQSPIMHAHDCTTPCLWVVGDADRRCPPSQAWAMHRVLCHTGTPSEVLVLPGCSHEGSTYGPPASRRAHDAALVEWMTRWVLSPAPT